MKEKILETIHSASKPLKAGEIAALSGLDKNEVDKALKILKSGNKINSPQRCFYEAKK